MFATTLIVLLFWFYQRKSFKRNLLDVYHWNNKTVVFLDLFFLYLIIFRLVFRYLPHLHHYSWFSPFYNSSYVLLGFLGLLTLILVSLDLEDLIFKVKSKFIIKESGQNIDNSRRNFLKKTLTFGGFASSTVITGVGYANSFDPKIKKVTIPLNDKHKNLQGLRIVQLSDIHIGPTLKGEFAKMLVERVNSLQPDLVVITGDIIDGEVETIKNEVLPFKDFQSNLGTHFVTGNHEYYWNGKAWIEHFESLGLIGLKNSYSKLNYKGEDFYLCGVHDSQAARFFPEHTPNYFKAQENIPDEKFKILLAHQPKSCIEAQKYNFHLQLSGHTHGGQGFPWNMIVYLVQPYSRGLYQLDKMHLYVNSGTGFWGPPNRFMIDSEITLIELT